MRKSILSFLVVVVLTCSIGASAESEIMFRKLDWFSTPAEVNNALLSEGATNTTVMGQSDFAFRLTIDNQKVNSFKKCIDYGFTNYYEGITVAGYAVDVIIVSYLYPLIDNQVVNDVSLAQIHMGAYLLQIPKTSSAKETYHDLTRKLSYLYGVYAVGESEELSDKGFPPRIWADLSGNIVLLAISGETAELFYYAGAANSRLDALQFSSDDSLDGL